MGLGEMLGIKTVKIKTNASLSLAELYEKIKTISFEGGAPELTKHGFTEVIAFPKIDNENQVWIIGKNGAFTVQRSTVIAGLKNAIVADLKAGVMDKLSGGITGMVSTFGSPKKACMAQVDIVAEAIKGLNL